MDAQKKKFVSILRGKNSYFDRDKRVIYLFEKIAPTLPDKFSLADLEFKINSRNVYTAVLKGTTDAVIEQVNRGSFRLLNGWSIDPESRSNVIHAGWTEETNEFTPTTSFGLTFPARKIRKFLTLQTAEPKDPVPSLAYVANTKDPDLLLQGPVTTFETQDGRYLHAVVEITEATYVRIVRADSGEPIYTIPLGQTVRDGTLITFPTKT